MAKKVKHIGIDRIGFETVVTRHKLTVDEIIQLKKDGKLKGDDWVFPLDHLIEVVFTSAKGHYGNCQNQTNPHTEWSQRQGNKLAIEIFKKAFYGKG